MKKVYFPTDVFRGTFNFDDKTFNNYKKWISLEKELDPEGLSGSTTVSGYQIGLKDNIDNWMMPFINEVKKIQHYLEKEMVISSWFVDYEPGGFQDPHYHPTQNSNSLTVIFNIRGYGELVLYDPRQIAVATGSELGVTEKLNDCEWIAIPTWLIHSSRPCPDKRSIFVIDLV